MNVVTKDDFNNHVHFERNHNKYEYEVRLGARVCEIKIMDNVTV